MRVSFLVILLLCYFSFQANAKLKVVATASIFMDMAKNIAGDKIDVFSIVPIGGDPHIYDPTPGDAALVASADIILINGLTFEGWLNELIENAGTKAKIILITQGINAITSEDFHNASDPHAWMTASNGLIYCENIKKALCDNDASNKDFYEKNYTSYKEKLVVLEEYIQKAILKIPVEKRILITSHDAFHYYGKHYGLKLDAVLGTSTDAEVQTSDLIRLNKAIHDYQIPAIFIESTINPKLLQQIATDNNCVIGGKLFADSIGDAESDAPNYLAMLRHNTDIIVTALSSQDNIILTKKPMSWSSFGFIILGFALSFAWFCLNIKQKRFTYVK